MKKDFSYGIIPAYKDVNGDIEFLLINQITNKGAFWWFPKGHAEKNENWLTAAKRELYEEVGIDDLELVSNKEFITDYVFQDGEEKIHKTVKYWLAFVKTKEVRTQESELNGYKWANFDIALGVLSHENTKNILKKAIKELW